MDMPTAFAVAEALYTAEHPDASEAALTWLRANVVTRLVGPDAVVEFPRDMSMEEPTEAWLKTAWPRIESVARGAV